MTMNTFFQKFLKVTTFATLVAVWLTACGKKEEIPPPPPQPKPEYYYMGKPVFTEKTYDWKIIKEGAWTFHCTPSGALMEVLYYGGRSVTSANVLDRGTGKPVSCDPATGKVFESK